MEQSSRYDRVCTQASWDILKVRQKDTLKLELCMLEISTILRDEVRFCANFPGLVAAYGSVIKGHK
jgi:hypothetical protein